ncbi:thymidylate synthase [Parasedimentitalea psychrophila]|uniref:Thymidylate synthase n=1 Tax=Parasedimentitalea psychrophila TaxID=2997337 RepID=A0A9Y2P8R5_9RHOB|nr:thymidylate synthase [Parasedimentitalea psychrophila]WIY27333.1 thymidylate synthase [Parasedimentitalea psychrophila]
MPTALASDVDSVSYDSASQTLTISGVGLDETPYEASYIRNAALDRAGYEAYTVQDSSLDRHTTAYVRQIEGAFAVAVATGGQFSYYMAGTNFGRTDAYTAPTTDQLSGGIVSYAGTYVGLLNIAGDGGDLLPVTPGTPGDVLPVQAAEITGQVLINADFADNRINGTIYDREITDYPTTIVETLRLKPTDIAEAGTFEGVTSVGLVPVGEYGGIFSGTDAVAVAGSIHVKDHIAIPDIEEYGIFVLGQCGGANSDPLCNQPVP